MRLFVSCWIILLAIILLAGCAPAEHGPTSQHLEAQTKARHIAEINRCHRLGMAYSDKDVEIECIEYPNSLGD